MVQHYIHMWMDSLATKRVPATTRVAAWMTADTDVGPSMASGNHEWIPMVTDFTETIVRSMVSSILPAHLNVCYVEYHSE